MSSNQYHSPALSTAPASEALVSNNVAADIKPQIFLQSPKELHDEYTWRYNHVELFYNIARTAVWDDIKSSPKSHTALLEKQLEALNEWEMDELEWLKHNRQFQIRLWDLNMIRNHGQLESVTHASSTEEEHLNMLDILLFQDMMGHNDNTARSIVSTTNGSLATLLSFKLASPMAPQIQATKYHDWTDRMSVVMAQRELLAYRRVPSGASLLGTSEDAAKSAAATGPRTRASRIAPQLVADDGDLPGERSSV